MKTAVVTGGNGGIGFHTALHLAKSGMHVVLACRDQGKGRDSMLRILGEVPQAKVELVTLDLSSLASVNAFATRLRSSLEKLDLLVNNAAVMALPKRTLSVDGNEMQFATNHLGHFALTAQLMPIIKQAEAPRVVTVSSIAHRYGKIDLSDLQSSSHYEGWQAYGNSKLENLLFSFELARKSVAAGSRVLSVAVHPGVAKTNILSAGPTQGTKVLRTYISEFLTKFFAQTDAEGALPSILACENESVQNGDFYGPDGFMEIAGKPTKVVAKPTARDEEMAKGLWSASEKIAGLTFNF